MKDSLRSKAAGAMRSTRETAPTTDDAPSKPVKPGLKISNLKFEVDAETEQAVNEQRSRISKLIGR